MRNAPRPLPDLTLERYHLRELPPAEMRRVETRLASDPALRKRLEALQASDQALRAEHAPERLAHRTQERLRRERIEAALREAPRDSRFRPVLKPLLAGAFLLALLAAPAWKILQGQSAPVREEDGIPLETGAGSVTEETRIKGLEPGLALFRKTAQGAEPLRPGAIARPGDRLRIGYHSGGLPYGAIFSVDGNGSVTRHWPPSGTRAGKLENGETLLPGAFELDAAPKYERFYLLVSERAFELNPVLESLHAHKPPASLAEGGKIKVVRFDLLKDNGI